MSDILLATGNPHKVDELRAIFAECGLTGVRFVGLGDLQKPTTEPAETGSTFEANAAAKALAYATQTGLTCLADDSGLEVDAIGGRPGVISSHYCTDGKDVGMSREDRDRENNAKLLKELSSVSFGKRGGRFVCVMVLAKPGQRLVTTRGAFEGRIGESPDVPRGANGFGYDPLFLTAPTFAQTSAELNAREKNLLSHRGVAARAMAKKIAQLRSERRI